MTDDERSPQPDATSDDWWFDEPRAREPGAPGARSLRTWIAAGAGALVLAAGAVAGITALSSDDSLAEATAGNAAPGAFGGMSPGQAGLPGAPGTAGTIERVDSGTFTLKTAAGESVDVTTSDRTQVEEATSASVDDLATHDRVVVIGDASGDEIAAMRIISGDDQVGAGGPPSGAPPGGPNGLGAPVRGVITKVDGATFELELDDGSTKTVRTSSETDVRVLRERAVSDLAAGDQVVVTGERNDGELAAATIRIGAPDALPGAPPPGSGGSRPGTQTV
jgi:hypothetical protein